MVMVMVMVRERVGCAGEGRLKTLLLPLKNQSYILRSGLA